MPSKQTTSSKASTESKVSRRPKFYSADPVRKLLPSNASHHKPPKLRKSIVPGTVLILLAGRYRGKRVVFLKQLTSGLLLVTGPRKINGVPLRRVNQKYVISTSTKVEVNQETFESINDEFFAKSKPQVPRSKESEFFYDALKKPEISPERKTKQKEVDTPLLATIDKVPDLRKYLHARFTLTRHSRPHEMKF